MFKVQAVNYQPIRRLRSVWAGLLLLFFFWHLDQKEDGVTVSVKFLLLSSTIQRPVIRKKEEWYIFKNIMFLTEKNTQESRHDFLKVFYYNSFPLFPHWLWKCLECLENYTINIIHICDYVDTEQEMKRKHYFPFFFSPFSVWLLILLSCCSADLTCLVSSNRAGKLEEPYWNGGKEKEKDEC